MDYRAIALPIGRLLILIAGFMLIPAAADLVAGHPDWVVFLASALMIACVGALIAAGPGDWNLSKIFGFIAVILASVNIFGGFIVTQRMLAMSRPNLQKSSQLKKKK